MTSVSTAHPLRWQQITPVFCDVDPCTHTLDPLGSRTDYAAHQREFSAFTFGAGLATRIARGDRRMPRVDVVVRRGSCVQLQPSRANDRRFWGG